MAVRIPTARGDVLAAMAVMDTERRQAAIANVDHFVQERESLGDYLAAVHRTDAGTPAIPPAHLRQVIAAIEDDSLGHTLIIAPPGSAKTLTMLAACGWHLGRDIEQHIGYLSLTADQARLRSLAVRDTITGSPEYRSIFPKTERDPGKRWTDMQWFLWRPDRSDKDPSLLASGAGGPIQGARMDRIVLDDIADPENMATALQRQKLIYWLTNVVKTRLTPRGRMIMICTRWDADDPAAWAMREGWRVIRIQAVQEDPTTGLKRSYWPERFPLHRIDCLAAGAPAHGTGDPTWEHSEERPEAPCWVERDAAGNVVQLGRCIRSGMSAREFNLVYQGETTDEESAIFKRQYWRYWPPEQPFQATRGALFVDLAHEEKTEADYTVISRWLMKPAAFLCTDVIRRRLEFPEVLGLLRGLVKSDMPEHEWPTRPEVLSILAARGRLTRLDPAPYAGMSIVIENVPGSKATIQTLKREVPGVIAWKIQSRLGTSKLARANSIIHLAEAGNVYLLGGALWLGDFVEEHAAFRGNGSTHDDQVDTTTTALLRFTGGGVLQTWS